jgi:hypothetical protein
LQKYSIDFLRAFFYANLINNFFRNLNDKNVKELKLPPGKIGQIRATYKQLLKNAKRTLCAKQFFSDEKAYNEFKNSLKERYPGFEKIVEEIERHIDINYAEEYFKEREEAITRLGKNPTTEFSNDFAITILVETYVKTKKKLPTGKNLDNLLDKGFKILIPAISQKMKASLDKGSRGMLDAQRKQTSDYTSSLYDIWKIPLDKIECLIRISLESGEKELTKLRALPDFKTSFKYAAIIKIHSRALHISNEILVLLKSGYSDGANSRWRSLHELAVISEFLYTNADEISKRYLDHELVRRFKEATDYQAECRGLGYKPLSRREYNEIRRAKESICAEYNDRFQDDYGWIPSSLLANRNFRALEQYVNLNRFHPFYNLSCDSVHGGPKGFYRIGLTRELQKNLLLIGPSIYGLADPLQNTAISLGQVSACLLALTKDFENIITMYVINSFVREIGDEALKTQKSIQKDN